MQYSTIEVEALANVHSHEREGEVKGPLIEASIEGGADVLGSMPNTDKGLTTAKQVIDYTLESLNLVPNGKKMTFIKFLMITEHTTEREVDRCIEDGIFDGKIYPLNRTVNSQNGVKNYGRLLPIIKHCGKVGMKRHFHPEHPWMLFDNRDAEFAFLPIVRMFLEETEGHIIWEHGTDSKCIPFWIEMASSGRFSVTLTAHHLGTSEDDTFGDASAVCKPPIKLARDGHDLRRLVEENHSWVMAGGDNAFHALEKKHPEKGKCACGAYTHNYLLPLYAHVLPRLMTTSYGLQTFVNFTSRNARAFHNLPESSRTVVLEKKPFKIPLRYQVGTKVALPFWGGKEIDWSIVQ